MGILHSTPKQPDTRQLKITIVYNNYIKELTGSDVYFWNLYIGRLCLEGQLLYGVPIQGNWIHISKKDAYMNGYIPTVNSSYIGPQKIVIEYQHKYEELRDEPFREWLEYINDLCKADQIRGGTVPTFNWKIIPR